MKSHFHSQRHRLDDSLFGCLENDGDYSEHYLIKFINFLRRYHQLGFNLQMEALEDSGGTISNVTLYYLSLRWDYYVKFWLVTVV